MNDKATGIGDAAGRRHTAWAIGLGGVVGGGLLWACSSTSNGAAVLGGTSPLDSSVGVEPDTSTGGRDAGMHAEAEAGAPACTLVDAGCVTAANCGGKVNQNVVAQMPPVATGGTVVPGTYVLTDYTVFTGTGGATGAQGSWTIETQYLTASGVDAGASEAGEPEGGDDASAADLDATVDAAAVEAGAVPQTLQLVRVTQSTTAPATTLTGTVTFSSPVNADIAYECPSTANAVLTTYSATATTLQLFDNQPVGVSGGIAVFTYTKQ